MAELLDRSIYRKVKQMTRDEMETFLNNIYAKGAESVEHVQVTEDELVKRLSTVKGLGEKRIAEILTVLEDLYKTNDE